MSTALYILKQHDHIGPGWLLDRCDPEDRPLRILTLRSPDDLPMAIECNGVVYAGRSLSPEQWQHKDPLLKAQVVFVRSLVALGVPYLGIDRGAQVLARAMLGELSDAPTPDVGWASIPLTSEGQKDPVLGNDAGTLEGIRWPTHRFTLPRKAVLLAGTPEVPDAFRFGDAAWGLLPHVELTLPGLTDWLDERGGPELDPATRATIRDVAANHADLQRDAAYRLMDRFLRRSSSFNHVPPPLAQLHLGPDHHNR